MIRRSLVLSLGIAVGLASTGAEAQADGTGDRVAAESLTIAASKLVAKGNYQEACEDLNVAARLDLSARRLLKLGECQERLGQTASAWISFSRAREFADGVDDAESMRLALASVNRLDKLLCRLVITVPSAADIPDLVIRKDGSVLSREVRDLEVAIDPGTHVISATAPGRHPWSTEIGVTLGPTTVTVTIPNLSDDRDYPLLGADMVPITPASQLGVEENRGRVQRNVGYILGGAGILTMGTGIAFGLQASATRADANDMCPDLRCAQQGVDMMRRAQSQAVIASTLFVLGAASLTGGAIVYFTAPSGRTEKKTAALQIAPSFGPGSAGVFAVGNF